MPLGKPEDHPALVSPAMLSWARENAGFSSVQEASKSTGFAATTLNAWESGRAKPWVSQARKLAEKYDVPLAFFYLKEPPDENVDHPEHYTANGIEAIDVIDAFGLGFNLGNVVKYVLRADRKGERLEDLRKAVWYLAREIERRE